MTGSDNTTPHGAPEYDRKVRQTIPFYETIHSEALDLATVAKPDATRWLDTGCGTGYLVELALPLFPRTQFILADPSAAMLRQARERLQGSEGARLRFLQPVGSEGLASRLDGATCQVVTAIQCHHYLRPTERERATQACYRVLDERGLYITFENIAPTTARGIRIALERWGRSQVGRGRAPSTVAEHLKRFNTRCFPITIGEHLELLRAVGFRVVEAFWLSQMQAGFYAVK